MNEILFSVLLVSVIGLFAGLLLAVLCINHDKGAIVKKNALPDVRDVQNA